MSLFDKRMSEEKRKSLELAEASRQEEWKCPSFVSQLFQGAVSWDLISPFPAQSKEDKAAGDAYLKKLEEFLKANLNPDEVDVTREIPQKVIKGLADLGAFAIKIPQEYGGLGFSQVNYNRVVHLLASYCGSTAALISAHQSIGVPQPLINHGTEEQKKKFLPRFRQGAISGFALTESEAGSDPRLLKTTATPTEDGKYYILNGEKLWCTNGNIADILVVMALTPSKKSGDKEIKQISAFIVESNMPGFEVSYRCKFMGLNAIQNGIIRFKNVKVPKENLIMGEGDGLKLAFTTLNTGRLTLPAAVIGASKWCLWIARRWAVERKQWGASIGEHEAIASKISRIAATVFAMEAMGNLVSHMADNKCFDIRLEAAMVKLFCTEESWKVINDTIQVRGGRGYETGPSLAGRGVAGYALERALRDARVNTILEGSSEIMHLFIAREALDFHLKMIKPLLDPRVPIAGKIKAAIAFGVTYLFWYPQLWLPSFGKVNAAEPLNRHMRYVQTTSKRLARELFHNMISYQQKLVERQNTINRFVDIGTYLFAISCACAYADSLAKKGEAGNSVELADIYCREIRVTIEGKFREVKCNVDQQDNKLAKKITAAEFAWLENDIIKEGSK